MFQSIVIEFGKSLDSWHEERKRMESEGNEEAM
jgi:hypothetical protein